MLFCRVVKSLASPECGSLTSESRCPLAAWGCVSPDVARHMQGVAGPCHTLPAMTYCSPQASHSGADSREQKPPKLNKSKLSPLQDDDLSYVYSNVNRPAQGPSSSKECKPMRPLPGSCRLMTHCAKSPVCRTICPRGRGPVEELRDKLSGY